MTTLETIRDALSTRYEVEREVGQGGMARVYLARDLKHDRQVALKVIASDVAVSMAAERFLREIQLCARLTHPHILPLLDSGNAGDQPFYVMPFVDGESIRDRLKRAGRLPVDEAVFLAREVADALDYAHAAGVLHRDIKPENVLILGSHAVVLDFGVGRAISAASDQPADLTMVGTVVGTPAYMSPEQASADANQDGRSDEYSLGVMLYEMLAGAQPFQGATAQAVMAKRFFETPPRVTVARPDVPEHVADAIAKALSREPAGRFATVGDFGRALGASGSGRATRSVAPQTTPLPSIAVVPFANVGNNPDNEFLSDGITDEVISALSRLRTLRVAARTSSYAIRDQREDVAAIGARLNVDSLLEGSVQRAGNRIRVKARLIKVADGFQIWSEQFDRELDDIFAIQDAISAAIVGALEATMLTGVHAAAAAVPAVATNAAAYERYLKGGFALNKRTEASLTRAVDLFSESIGADANYAPAYAGLADAYVLLCAYGARDPRTAMPLARMNAERALALDPSLAGAHATLARIAGEYEHDWATAEAEFARALTLDPTHVAALQWRAINLFVPQRRLTDAVADVERARMLDPLSLVVGMTAALVRVMSGDVHGGMAQFDEQVAADPTFGMVHFFHSMALTKVGRIADAKASVERAIALTGGSSEMLSLLAEAKAALGDTAGAEADLASLKTRRAERYTPASMIAKVHIALGRHDEAMEWLQTAYVEREIEVVYLMAKDTYLPLRGRADFAELVRAVGLPASLD